VEATSRNFWAALLAAMALVAVGCGGGRAYLKEALPAKPSYRVGVLDFRNLSETLSIGLERRLTEAAQFELFTKGRYYVAGRGEMDSARQRLEIKGDRTLGREEIKSLGEALDLDLVIWGEVLEYERADVLRAFNSVRVMLSIADAKSGEEVGKVEYGELSMIETAESLARRVVERAVGMLDGEFKRREEGR
jgi:hypothetical protein